MINKSFFLGLCLGHIIVKALSIVLPYIEKKLTVWDLKAKLVKDGYESLFLHEHPYINKPILVGDKVYGPLMTYSLYSELSKHNRELASRGEWHLAFRDVDTIEACGFVIKVDYIEGSEYFGEVVAINE